MLAIRFGLTLALLSLLLPTATPYAIQGEWLSDKYPSTVITVTDFTTNQDGTNVYQLSVATCPFSYQIQVDESFISVLNWGQRKGANCSDANSTALAQEIEQKVFYFYISYNRLGFVSIFGNNTTSFTRRPKSLNNNLFSGQYQDVFTGQIVVFSNSSVFLCGNALEADYLTDQLASFELNISSVINNNCQSKNGSSQSVFQILGQATNYRAEKPNLLTFYNNNKPTLRLKLLQKTVQASKDNGSNTNSSNNGSGNTANLIAPSSQNNSSTNSANSSNSSNTTAANSSIKNQSSTLANASATNSAANAANNSATITNTSSSSSSASSSSSSTSTSTTSTTSTTSSSSTKNQSSTSSTSNSTNNSTSTSSSNSTSSSLFNSSTANASKIDSTATTTNTTSITQNTTTLQTRQPYTGVQIQNTNIVGLWNSEYFKIVNVDSWPLKVRFNGTYLSVQGCNTLSIPIQFNFTSQKVKTATNSIISTRKACGDADQPIIDLLNNTVSYQSVANSTSLLLNFFDNSSNLLYSLSRNYTADEKNTIKFLNKPGNNTATQNTTAGSATNNLTSNSSNLINLTTTTPSTPAPSINSSPSSTSNATATSSTSPSSTSASSSTPTSASSPSASSSTTPTTGPSTAKSVSDSPQIIGRYHPSSIYQIKLPQVLAQGITYSFISNILSVSACNSYKFTYSLQQQGESNIFTVDIASKIQQANPGSSCDPSEDTLYLRILSQARSYVVSTSNGQTKLSLFNAAGKLIGELQKEAVAA